MLADPLSILYQDEWLVAVDKPAGQLVHPAGSPQEGDQVTMKILRDQIGQRVNSVHRLDRPTCGVLLFTKDRNSAQRMGQIFEKHSVRKIYWAVINGQPRSAQWISRKSLKKYKHGICRTAETVFHVLEGLDHELTLVEASPTTGRFHQIRQHLLQAGHPIVGDYRYAGVEHCDALGTKLGTGTRMLLQARQLCFTHPMTGEEMFIEAPVDPLIQRLRRR